MAVENFGIDITFKASADLSSYQYYFVEITADNTVGVVNALTDKPAGVLQNKPAAAGRAAVVRVLGVSKVSSDAALTYGATIGPSADGQAVTRTLTPAGGDASYYYCGQVITGTGAAGDIGEAMINCINPVFIQAAG